MAPPKSPRNIFFPWQNFVIHKSGSYLQPNRIALRVPVNLTKFEIRDYLRKIYDAKVIKVNTMIKVPRILKDFVKGGIRYHKSGPIYKKAYITLEDTVPDSVKMLGYDFKLHANPAITKSNITYGTKCKIRPNRLGRNLPKLLYCQYGHKLPLPNLLNDDNLDLEREIRGNSDERSRMEPDHNLPHFHRDFYTAPEKPENVPPQINDRINLTPWRRRISRLENSDTFGPKDLPFNKELRKANEEGLK